MGQDVAHLPLGPEPKAKRGVIGAEAGGFQNMSNLRTRISDEKASVLVIASLSMCVLLSVLGFAIDVGHFWLEERILQDGADAPALAAALEIRNCGSTATCA